MIERRAHVQKRKKNIFSSYYRRAQGDAEKTARSNKGLMDVVNVRDALINECAERLGFSQGAFFEYYRARHFSLMDLWEILNKISPEWRRYFAQKNGIAALDRLSERVFYRVVDGRAQAHLYDVKKDADGCAVFSGMANYQDGRAYASALKLAIMEFFQQ